MAPTTFGFGKQHEQQASREEELLPASLLAAARPFLRGELAKVDPELPSLVSVVQAAGAGECYHKHSTFFGHLLGVYRILRMWGAPDAVARCGLFHSAYSNSYVDLAIVGAPAERLVHLFCVVPRHRLVHDDLLFHYTDGEIRDHLAASQASLFDATAASATAINNKEPWRMKLRSVVPAEGVVVKHIRTGEPVALSRRMVAVFVLMTIADFSDQYTDYQDKLFANDDGRLEFRGNNLGTMWPGSGKPGLWMNAMSRLAALYCLIARDVELDKLTGGNNAEEEDASLELVIPPVFDHCTVVLDPEEQRAARDLYWQVVSGDEDADGTRVEALLRESIARNPFVGEPHLVLAQALLNAGRYDEAAAEAERGLRLFLEWGSSWDKRVSWEGWVAWGRMMRDKAKEKDWPTTAFGVIGLGLVHDVKHAPNN